MNDYKLKPIIEWIVTSLLKDLTINKDYVIAGGFVRDQALGLSPKDIDIFVRDGACETELDWELLLRDDPRFILSTLLGDSDYISSKVSLKSNVWSVRTGPAETLDRTLWEQEGDNYPRRLEKVQEEKDPIQELKTISKVEEVLYTISPFPINFVHCTLKKGFTPENLVDTFDYTLVQGYVKDDLSLSLPKDFEKDCENKSVWIFPNKDENAQAKTLERVKGWLERHIELMGWSINIKNPKQSLKDKVFSPYTEFVRRNGKPKNFYDNF